jgi:hypothetical protein
LTAAASARGVGVAVAVKLLMADGTSRFAGIECLAIAWPEIRVAA